ncbi:MAG: preprotein translocase subunit YajC [Candidatus Omnitrophica bacterium]|nr:preprotein translocase subunit YajC [Candidatus Omnitrophota bacterium]
MLGEQVVFAQGVGNAAVPAGGSAGVMVLLPMYAIIFAFFYFLIVRPQKKKQQEHQKMLETIKKNDEVVTTGGILGTVSQVKDKTVVVRVDDNVKIEVLRSAIASVTKSRAAG